MAGDRRTFPIMLERSDRKRLGVYAGFAIPWDMIAPHERQALRNHDQTLERLAQRGGLSPREALCVLDGEAWWKRTMRTADEAFDELRRRADAFLAGGPE